jgi:hypothetical protein
MDLSRVTVGDKVLGAAGILLVIDLWLLPWHTVFSQNLTALDPPGGRWGTLALILTLAILAVTAIRRFTKVALPPMPRPVGEITLGATAIVLALLVVKLAADPDFLGFGSYLGVALAAAMVAGASLGRHETDEVPPVGSGRGTPPTPF